MPHSLEAIGKKRLDLRYDVILPFEDGRSFFPTAPEELRAMAKEFMLDVVSEREDRDTLGRGDPFRLDPVTRLAA